MTREQLEAQAVADAELAKRRQLWTGRLTDPSGAVVLQAWGMPRHELEIALSAALFAHAPGINRGEVLRVELEPYHTPEQLAARARGR